MKLRHTTRFVAVALLLHVSVAHPSELLGTPLKDDAETVANAKEMCPDLLELRLEIDELYAEYRKLRLTFGSQASREAERKAPRLERTLVKKIQALEKLHEKRLAPVASQLERAKDDEGKLLERISKLGDRGRDTAKEDAKLDVVSAKIEELQTTSDTINCVGVPAFSTKGMQHMDINHLIKPNEQEEAALNSLIKNCPKLVDYRLKLEHLRHDLAAAQQPVADAEAASLSPQKIEKSLSSVEGTLRKGLEKIRAPYTKQLEEIHKQDEKLAAKVQRAGGRASALKYQQLLNNLAAKGEGLERTLKLLDRFSPDYKPQEKKPKSKKKATAPKGNDEEKPNAKRTAEKGVAPEAEKAKQGERTAPEEQPNAKEVGKQRVAPKAKEAEEGNQAPPEEE